MSHDEKNAAEIGDYEGITASDHRQLRDKSKEKEEEKWIDLARESAHKTALFVLSFNSFVKMLIILVIVVFSPHSLLLTLLSLVPFAGFMISVNIILPDLIAKSVVRKREAEQKRKLVTELNSCDCSSGGGITTNPDFFEDM